MLPAPDKVPWRCMPLGRGDTLKQISRHEDGETRSAVSAEAPSCKDWAADALLPCGGIRSYPDGIIHLTTV